MVRAVVSEAEKPAKAGDHATSFVPREQGPQQTAQETPAAPAREAAKAGPQAALARLIKELGQEDPALKEAARPRRKALKAVLQALQSPTGSADDRIQLLLKNLVTQASEVGRLEREHVPTQLKCDHQAQLLTKAETELRRQEALNERLQGLCRSLQAQYRLAKEQLDRTASLQEAERAQSSSLQEALHSITARLDGEKERLGKLQAATEQNCALRQEIGVLARQVELQQQLAQRQEEKYRGIEALLAAQREADAARSRAHAEAVAQLREQNQALREQVAEHEAMHAQQEEQMQACSDAMREIKQSFETYEGRHADQRTQIAALNRELAARRTVQKALQAEVGDDVLGGLRKRAAAMQALQGLCRALQEENRQLKAGAAAADTVADSAASDGEGAACQAPEAAEKPRSSGDEAGWMHVCSEGL